MAKIYELSAEWEAWVDTRPPEIQKMCRQYPPDRLYRMKDTGHRVTIRSYSEDGTVTVIVSAEFNMLTFEREVFGVDPKDLEECDVPGPDVKTGVLFQGKEEVDSYIRFLREKMRSHEIMLHGEGKMK